MKGRRGVLLSGIESKVTGSRLPLFEGLLPIDSKRAPTDLLAGVTLAALAIPEAPRRSARCAGKPGSAV